jgi:xylulokinase
MLASALERPLVIRDAAEVGPALGAARLAALAVRQATEQEICVPPPVARIIEPDPTEVIRWRERSERFRSLYRALHDQFSREVTH